jgi:hypothetical protein
MDPLPHRSPSLLDPQLLWATCALIATLLLGALIFAWLDRWRKRAGRDVLTPTDQLTDFRSSYERGELSQEEYQRIRARLAPKIKRQIGAEDKAANRERRRPEPQQQPPIINGPGSAGHDGLNGEAGTNPGT